METFTTVGTRSRRRSPAAAAALLLMGCSACMAFEVKTDVAGLSLTWESTVKYSNAFRVRQRDETLLVDPNQDDGDRNFGRGLISNRFDVLTELTGKYRTFGLRLSGAGWYDTVYNRDGRGPSATQNTLPGNLTDGGFAKATRDLHGRKAEVLDAFVAMDLDIAGNAGVVRIGKHAQVWGESLFYGSNAIAGAMTPVDAIKLASVPGTPFKEALLPVPQLSAQLQLGTHASIAAYYQMRWRSTRLPATGSYFSSLDPFFDGGDFLLSTAPGDPTYTVLGPPVPRNADRRPKNSGQGGLSLRLRALETDFGVYWVRFHEKTPLPVLSLASVPTPIGNQIVPVGYAVAYHQGTQAIGASASRSFGAWNIAAEASLRRDQAVGASRASAFGAFDNSGNAPYAIGKTAHVNLSTLASLGRSPLWDDAALVAEVAWNRLLSVQRNAQAIDANAKRDAIATTVSLTPTYYQALQGVDLEVPIVLSFAPKGSRSAFVGPSQTTGGGALSIGASARYLDTWRITANFTHYYGGAELGQDVDVRFTYGQYLADRDFLAFSVSRAF